ncbi:aldo/keto reductase [Ligilactobacillus murinus]|uniref:aldo/keto reductase n=1 Tax=Ligilactobacillus murinus TaxID=1622 RepID=UPI00296AA935|nr:aldo/keto reductase [Ligilactobacillus murinus]WOY89529.1 aldo/keto reductase [Ligilactobacillus murinus]
MEYTTLNNGIKMPKLGFGVYQVADQKECEQSVLCALNAGYRLLDTSAAYFNEEAVGNAIKKSNIAREDLFITTKLWIQDANYEKAKKAFENSLKKLQLDYLDLYLIHQPFGDYYGAWRMMTELYKEGRIRAIGVSNFGSDRLVDLILNNEVIPAVNQIEYHPYFQQKDAIKVMKEENVQPEAWSPLGHGGQVLKNPILAEISEKYHKSIAQVILRWNLQNNVITIPKSVHQERIESNFDIFDFVLSKNEMEIISTLDRNEYIADLHDVNLVKQLNGLKVR